MTHDNRNAPRAAGLKPADDGLGMPVLRQRIGRDRTGRRQPASLRSVPGADRLRSPTQSIRWSW